MGLLICRTKAEWLIVAPKPGMGRGVLVQRWLEIEAVERVMLWAK